MAPVSSSPHKFVRQPCCYYLLQDIKNYEVEVFSNGMTFIPNFIKIGPLVEKYDTHTHTDRI
jgi:hypothetical protein